MCHQTLGRWAFVTLIFYYIGVYILKARDCNALYNIHWLCWCGYNCVMSTPPDASISKYMWSPFMKAEYINTMLMVFGNGVFDMQISHKYLAQNFKLGVKDQPKWFKKHNKKREKHFVFSHSINWLIRNQMQPEITHFCYEKVFLRTFFLFTT